MRNSLAMKCLAAVALGIMFLAHLSPVAAGMLLCIGDGSEPDCCRDGDDSYQSHLEEPTQLRDGSDCACCITVDAGPPIAGAGSLKASIDVTPESALPRKVSVPTGARNPGFLAGSASETRLSSIRTVVLLI